MALLDQPIRVTCFDTLGCNTSSPAFEPVRVIAEWFRTERAATKEQLRLLIPAGIGRDRTDKGSLKHDANLIEIAAIVLDSDAGDTSIDIAVAAMKAAGVGGFIAATARHNETFPKWRCVLPLHRPLHKKSEFVEHSKLISRAAGIFPGVFDGASWAKAQGWFVGTVTSAPAHRVELVEGEFLDDLEQLDVSAKPKPSQAKPERARTETEDRAALDLAAALEALTAGKGSHDGLIYAAGLFAGQAIPIATAAAMLLHAIDQRPDAGRDAGWTNMRSDVGRTLRWAYAKQAATDASDAEALGIGIDDTTGQDVPVGGNVVTENDPWANPQPSVATPEPPEEEEEPDLDADWPEPVALAGFHGPIGEAVALLMPETEADAQALLFQTLAFVGNRIGRGPYYPVKKARHYCNLFVLLAGATSRARKGTSETEIRSVFEVNAADPWLELCIQSGLSSGEGVIHAVRDACYEINKKTNVRELVDEGVSDKRLLIVESEFASPLAVMKRQGNTLSPVLRKSWDASRLQIMTKNAPARATGALISVVGHITIDELRGEVDRIAISNGFLNRFLFAVVRRARKLPFGGTVDQTQLDAVGWRLAEAVEAARGIEAVTMSEAARELWTARYDALSSDHAGLFGSLISRSEAQTARLALIYALADQSAVIEPVHLEAALAVWRYSEDSARLLFGPLVGDQVADSLLVFLKGAGKAGMTRTELYNAMGRNTSSARIQLALQLLLKQGRVRRAKSRLPGRVTGPFAETWFVTRSKANE